MHVTLGIDVACRAAHHAALAGPDGKFIFSGVKFFTRPADLDALWTRIGRFETLTVVLELTPDRVAQHPDI